jgi:AAA+ superfamily predicted ATPase
MDPMPPGADSADADPRALLEAEVARVREEAEELDRQIAADSERLAAIRSALDGMVGAVWREVYSVQQHLRERESLLSALTFQWCGSYQLAAAAGFAIVAAAAMYIFQVPGFFAALAVFLVLMLIGWLSAREQCLTLIKKARSSYLGDDGRDMRFVTFTHVDHILQHPLIGFDGPNKRLALEDRAWKIPGVRDDEALQETFLEVIDERRANVLLTRFPDKKPTLVHADLENPFIRAYGVFLQRALERHLSQFRTQADDFHEIVVRYGKRKKIEERLRVMEAELDEFDGTAAILKQLPLSIGLRNKLLRQVVLFRLGDPSVSRGLFIIGDDRFDMTDVLQMLARASAAALLQLSFSQIKIGYVGQGAATVGRTFQTARRMRSIVSVDEAERFFSASGSSAYESMRKEAAHAFFTEWDALDGSPDVWIVAAARSKEGLDEGVLARFGSVIDCSQPAPVRHDDPVRQSTYQFVPPPPEEASPLPDPVAARVRLLAAMFAHVETMESQGISVPRGVLVAGSSQATRHHAIAALAEQTSLPVIGAVIDAMDVAMDEARAAGRALLAVDLPEYADPGVIAHLAVMLDRLAEEKLPFFVLAAVANEASVEPELRTRFAELLDLAELDEAQRSAKLTELFTGKPLDFDLNAELGGLVQQTAGMTEEQVRQFVDEAVRKAALRAIDGGTPDHVLVAIADFGTAEDTALAG